MIIKQFICISFCLVSFNMIAMDSTSPTRLHQDSHLCQVFGAQAGAPKEQRRMDVQKPIMATPQQIQIMGAGLTHRMPAPDDVSVEIHSPASQRVLLDVEGHVQMLRRRNMWASDEPRLRMFDNESHEDESCMQMARRCGGTALHCISLQSVLFYFDLFRLLRTHLN